MISRFAAAVMAVLIPTAFGGALAADYDNWAYRGPIQWTHPDGRVINGVYANSRVNDDRMSLIKDGESGRIYIQFMLLDNATVLDRPSRFFIQDGPDRKTAKRIYFEVDGRAWPRSGRTAGIVVTQVTAADEAAIRRYSGNQIGVRYYSQKAGESEPKARSFAFPGRDIANVLAVLKDATVPDRKRPLAPSTSSGNGYFPYQFKWQPCTKPRYATLRSREQARRFVTVALAFNKCRRDNSKRVRQELQDHVRRQGGKLDVKLTERKTWQYSFAQPSGCNCRAAFTSNVRSVIDALDSYVIESNGYQRQSEQLAKQFRERR